MTPNWTDVFAPNVVGRCITAMWRLNMTKSRNRKLNSRDVIKKMSGTGLSKNGPGKNGSRIIGLVVRVGKNGPFIKECGDKNGPIGIYVKLKKTRISAVADRPRDAENASEALILPRDAGIKRFLSRHAVSVCISDTFVDSVKTNKHIFKIFSPSGSQAILHCEPKKCTLLFLQ